MKNDYYSGTYIPGIVKWGKITLLLGIFAGFLPALVMAFRGYMPPVSAIIAGTLMQISVSGAFYIVEPISYFPILGIPGTYLTFLSGNTSNMRVPCSSVAQVCGSLGWLIFTFLFCDKMDKVNHLMSKGNAKMVPIISAGAMLGAFANLASGNFFTAEGSLTFTNAPAIATIAGCVIMMVLVKLSRARDIAWLREWAFAIAMFSGMFIGYAVSVI